MLEEKDILKSEFDTLPGIDAESIIASTLDLAHTAFRTIASDEQVLTMQGHVFCRELRLPTDTSVPVWRTVADTREVLYEADERIHGHGTPYALSECGKVALAAFSREYKERFRARMCAERKPHDS